LSGSTRSGTATINAVDAAMSEVDLGPCRGRTYDRGADRWAVILPGANYLPDAPLLWFAREAIVMAGYNVLAVWDTFDRKTDGQAWVDQRTQAALAHVTGVQPLLVAKSLTTLAAHIAAERSLEAVWLTPIIAADHPLASAVVAGLKQATRPCLLVGGLADWSWDAAVARSIPDARVVEIADADHALQVPGNVERSLDALRSVTHAIGEFARARPSES